MTLNLSEISNKIAQSNIAKVDALTSKYIEETIKHITERGDRIEDYALVLINNPMQMRENGIRVTMQYRIAKISDIENLPVYGDE